MKRFRALAQREDHKHSGVFEAATQEEALQKLKDQGYQILSIQEVKPIWPIVLLISLITVALIALILWLAVFRKPADPLQKKGSYRLVRVRSHQKTPLDVLGKWVGLKSGPHLIATSEQALSKALHYKKTGDTKKLSLMFSRNEVGVTQKYGGGQKVYVHVWRDAERIVGVKFKDSNTTAWVEESAVI